MKYSCLLPLRLHGAHSKKGRGPLTSAEDDAFIGDLVLSLQARAVPTLITKLVLALMDSNLDALNGWRCHIRIPHTNLQLSPGQTGQCQANCIGIEHRFQWQLQAKDLIGERAEKEIGDQQSHWHVPKATINSKQVPHTKRKKKEKTIDFQENNKM